ncbi:hypothetical protein HPB47_006793 [Ixodes persulcatus]|uniref:Uncharacterized protein n=1 Tax=Ixodes persulcatus TaxID=34615 RepID=A0AC60P9Z0_IXOPE|nr:hypothetical protein HPB47_006793 [Ixodes persulcatus]
MPSDDRTTLTKHSEVSLFLQRYPSPVLALTEAGLPNHKKVRKSCVNWDVFRTALDLSQGDIPSAIIAAIKKATKTTNISEWLPEPDMMYLNLAAARTRAQRRFRKTGSAHDKSDFNKISAKLRRHAKSLLKPSTQEWPPWEVAEISCEIRIEHLRSKKARPALLAKSAVEDHLERKHCGKLHIYTDGSVNRARTSSTAAFYIPETGAEWSGKLEVATSSTTAELVAIERAPNAAAELPPNTVGELKKQGAAVYLQWIPGHVGVKGNEKADSLATEAHKKTASITIPADPRKSIQDVQWHGHWSGSHEQRRPSCVAFEQTRLKPTSFYTELGEYRTLAAPAATRLIALPPASSTAATTYGDEDGMLLGCKEPLAEFPERAAARHRDGNAWKRETPPAAPEGIVCSCGANERKSVGDVGLFPILESGADLGAEEFLELHSGLVSFPELHCGLLIWAAKWKREQRETLVMCALQAVALCPEALFPNVHRLLEILATLPVTTAEAEGSFPSLRRLKTYLRASTSNERLLGLALLNVHRDMEVQAEDGLDILCRQRRRLHLNM